MLHANLPATSRLNEALEPEIKPDVGDFPFGPDTDAFFGNRTYGNLLMGRLLVERRVRVRQEDVLVRIDSLLDMLGRTE